jgi:hypothetical protein
MAQTFTLFCDDLDTTSERFEIAFFSIPDYKTAIKRLFNWLLLFPRRVTPKSHKMPQINSLRELTFCDPFSLIASDLAPRRTSQSVIAPYQVRSKENPSDKANVSLRRTFTVHSSLRPCHGTGRCFER